MNTTISLLFEKIKKWRTEGHGYTEIPDNDNDFNNY
jgi:hypothetical protein